MANDFTSWRWSSEHVQTEIENGEFLSAESTLILAGPPSLTKVNQNSTVIGGAAANIGDVPNAETILFPIGLLAGFSMNQGRNIQSAYEIGSTRRYLVPEKIVSNLRLDRAKFFGPSLLRVLYAYYPQNRLGGSGTPLKGAWANGTTEGDKLPDLTNSVPGYGEPNIASSPNIPVDQKENRDFWINLQSMVFRQPMGLCSYFKASNDKPYGAAYMEECLISQHTVNMGSNQVMILEGVTIEFDRVAPINIVGGDLTGVA